MQSQGGHGGRFAGLAAAVEQQPAVPAFEHVGFWDLMSGVEYPRSEVRLSLEIPEGRIPLTVSMGVASLMGLNATDPLKAAE